MTYLHVFFFFTNITHLVVFLVLFLVAECEAQRQINRRTLTCIFTGGMSKTQQDCRVQHEPAPLLWLK